MGFQAQQDQWNALDVSRETLDRLQAYGDLLVKWQAKINLVSNSTLDDLWTRHLLDSAQVYPYLPENCKTLVDIGCGAGFPGLVWQLWELKMFTWLTPMPAKWPLSVKLHA